jgi:L-rhamnose mutarotase
MNCSGKREKDWLEEAWRIKEDLSAKARSMGVRNYSAFAEEEADRILKARKRPEPALAYEKRPEPYEGD